MIRFQLSLDSLGQTRFAYSPLSEVASSLRILDCPVGLALQPWQRAGFLKQSLGPISVRGDVLLRGGVLVLRGKSVDSP